ncbi:MAG: hypothetical protein ABIH34_02105 [Nanoarchaeota archaeon]
MKLKVRHANKDGISRIECSGELKEIMINEDFLHPKEESVSLCWRGLNSSGIIDLTPSEIEMLSESVKNRLPLIKGLKRLGGEGAIKL